MTWRSASLFAGVASLIGAVASITYGGPTSLTWTLGMFGAAATVVGIAPEQLFIIFKIPELRKKIFITLLFLAVYRIGFYVPLPVVDQVKLQEKMQQASTGALRSEERRVGKESK